MSAAGRVSFAYKGRRVTTLQAGRYTISVIDRGATSGLILENAQTKHPAVRVTGGAFVGRRSLSVDLTAGNWLVVPSLPGGDRYSIVVT